MSGRCSELAIPLRKNAESELLRLWLPRHGASPDYGIFWLFPVERPDFIGIARDLAATNGVKILC